MDRHDVNGGIRLRLPSVLLAGVLLLSASADAAEKTWQWSVGFVSSAVFNHLQVRVLQPEALRFTTPLGAVCQPSTWKQTYDSGTILLIDGPSTTGQVNFFVTLQGPESAQPIIQYALFGRYDWPLMSQAKEWRDGYAGYAWYALDPYPEWKQRVDSWNVPEPSGFLALFSGIAVLGGMIARRRK
jgi:hypothetical protein